MMIRWKLSNNPKYKNECLLSFRTNEVWFIIVLEILAAVIRAMTHHDDYMVLQPRRNHL